MLIPECSDSCIKILRSKSILMKTAKEKNDESKSY